MKRVVIVQARMTSTRLPGKILADLERRPMLAQQLSRLRRCRRVDQIIIATTVNATDDPVVALAADEGLECYRGSEDDLLSRYVEAALMVGADKISLNTAAVETPELITEVARRFGSQCVVVSIDFRKHPDGRYETYTGSGHKPTGLDPVEWAKEAERREAGEILLTFIERDGAMTGYDVELTRRVTEAVSIPVIAAAAIYHFTQQTPLEAKRYLRERGFAVRI